MLIRYITFISIILISMSSSCKKTPKRSWKIEQYINSGYSVICTNPIVITHPESTDIYIIK